MYDVNRTLLMPRKLVPTDTAGVHPIRHGPMESPEFARWNEQVLLRPQGIYGLQNLDVGILNASPQCSGLRPRFIRLNKTGYKYKEASDNLEMGLHPSGGQDASQARLKLKLKSRIGSQADEQDGWARYYLGTKAKLGKKAAWSALQFHEH